MQADSLPSEAAALKQEYEAKLRDINKEAEAILSETRKKAMDNEAKIIAKAKEDAAAIIERAHVEAELEKKKITDDVKKEMISVAAVLAQKAVGASMDYTIQDRLVDPSEYSPFRKQPEIFPKGRERHERQRKADCRTAAGGCR